MRRHPKFVYRLASITLSLCLAVAAHSQQTSGRTHLTVVCFWQNFAAKMTNDTTKQPYENGCEKYKEPTHCLRTATEIYSDTKRDWERVTANGLIYTVSCKHNCKKLLVPGDNHDAETDGKSMWITFESPDNKNWVETFEIFDMSAMKDETAPITQESSSAPTQPSKSTAAASTAKVGTGFFVSEQGHILTNAHVLSDCKQIRTRDGLPASLVSKDDGIDLALLKLDAKPTSIATFRLQPVPRIGDAVIGFGFPLQGVLSSEGNLSTGTVSAMAGMGDDSRFMQFSAPIQPGSSGGALLDSGGDVIGVVQAKLDAVETLRFVGDIPQNVNFAIQGFEAIEFLARNRVPYHVEVTAPVSDFKVADVAAKARQFSVPIECVE